MNDPYRAPPRRRPHHDYLCRACGRDVARSARHCSTCGAAVASVRCAACFHMNVPEDALCTGCGQPLGLEPVGEPSGLACSRCHQAFARFRGARGSLYDCDACGGQFVEHALLSDLLEQHDLYGSAAPRRPKRFMLQPGPLAYLACPVCRTPMNRKNFGRSSGVIIDICSAHGTWFDSGELPHVLAFVESGGLAAARRLEQEEQHRARVQKRVSDAEATFKPLSAPVRTQTDVVLLGALVHWIKDFLNGP